MTFRPTENSSVSPRYRESPARTGGKGREKREGRKGDTEGRKGEKREERKGDTKEERKGGRKGTGKRQGKRGHS
jgi:hypothetical protein